MAHDVIIVPSSHGLSTLNPKLFSPLMEKRVAFALMPYLPSAEGAERL